MKLYKLFALVVLVVVLVILLLPVLKNVANCQWMKPCSSSTEPPSLVNLTCTNDETGKETKVKIQTPTEGYGAPKLGATNSYEQMTNKAMNENMEYFAVCGSGNGGSSQQSCSESCDPNAEHNFAKFEYGAPGYSYQDYVSSQGVDNQVIQNHLQFVRDRKGLGPEGALITGKTFSPDSHDSYDPVPWVGIRGRPEYVQRCNPSTLADVDENMFKGNRKFCFWT